MEVCDQPWGAVAVRGVGEGCFSSRNIVKSNSRLPI